MQWKNPNLIIYYIGKSFPAVANLLIIVLGVKLLGEANYGAFNLVYNFALIVAAIFAGWIQQCYLRFAGKPDAGEINSQLHRYSYASALFGFIVCMILINIFFSLQWPEIIGAAFFSSIWILLSARLSFFQSLHRSIKYSITEGLFALSVTIMLCAFFLFHIKISSANMMQMLIVSALVGLVYAYTFRNRQTYAATTDTAFLRSALNFGLPMTTWLFMANLFNVTDRYMISHFYDNAATGVYAAVYDLVYKIIGFAALPFLLTFHPVISNHFNAKNYKLAYNAIFTAIGLQLLMYTCVGGVLFGVNSYVNIFQLLHISIDVKIFYRLLFPLAVSGVLWQVSLFVHKPLELLGHQYIMIVLILISLLSNIVLNYFLLPIYGSGFAAITTFISTAIYFSGAALCSIYYSQKPAA